MNNHQLKKIILKIHGMHCASCEVVIERKFRKIAGVEKVNVSYANGKTEVYCSREPNLHELQNSIKPDGYTISLWPDVAQASTGRQGRNADAELSHKNTRRDYFQIGAIFLIIVAT
ncbi:MAG: heavy metal-associated domain-containing protein, partial [Patescibacteria group bacterium]